jgi:6,7-dimethyl-8-ribityllumazine synthase
MTNIDNNLDLLISLNASPRRYELINLDLNNKEITNLDIIVLYSSYNLSINESLLNGYLNELDTLKFNGKVAIVKIPGGAFELPVLSSRIINKYNPKITLVIGCIVKGDTKHYDFLSTTVTNAISTLSIETGIPILNGVLTVENKQQAVDRAGAKLDKGCEYANATIQILDLLEKL